jgi:hypothetical protein
MKVVAIFLVVLCLAAIAGLGWLYLNSNLTVSFAQVIATDPVTQPEAFSTVKNGIASDTFTGTSFTGGEMGSPEDYLFYTWTVHLENNSFLPARVIEMRITPMSGDVLVLGDMTEHSLSPHSSGDLSVTALTARSMHSVREAVVTWYVWGLPFSARLTLGR